MKDGFNEHITEIERTIGYEFRDKSLLAQAFTRTSLCNEQSKSETVRYSSNEVLEFIGDGVLSLAIITVLMQKNIRRYEYGIETALGEGDFSNIKSKLSDKKNLSDSMRELGLQKFLRMGEGDAKLGIENEPSVMEDLFESIVGAVYIDCEHDMRIVTAVISGMLDTGGYLDREKTVLQSHKNAVQEWCADRKRRLPPPVYETVSESGPDHKKLYVRACIIGGRVMGTGEGKNRKIADSAAAEAALKALKAEESARPMARNEMDSASALRSFCSGKKLPAPVFTDLGDDPTAGSYAREFVFSCSVGRLTKSAKGRSKSEAREQAARAVLEELRK